MSRVRVSVVAAAGGGVTVASSSSRQLAETAVGGESKDKLEVN